MMHGQRKSATSKVQAVREAKKETGLLTPKKIRACKSRLRSMIQMSSPRNGPGISPTGAPSFPGKSEFVPKTTPMCSTKVSSMFRQPKSRISEQPEGAPCATLALRGTQHVRFRSHILGAGPDKESPATSLRQQRPDTTGRRLQQPNSEARSGRYREAALRKSDDRRNLSGPLDALRAL